MELHEVLFSNNIYYVYTVCSLYYLWLHSQNPSIKRWTYIQASFHLDGLEAGTHTHTHTHTHTCTHACTHTHNTAHTHTTQHTHRHTHRLSGQKQFHETRHESGLNTYMSGQYIRT